MSAILFAGYFKLPGALIASALGILVAFPVISLVALCKSPYMLFKGWHRLFHDLIGREGPFLETVCVPIAGLAILLWPLAVAGAVLGSSVSSIFLGAYAGESHIKNHLFTMDYALWSRLCPFTTSIALIYLT
ncbi:unnamed protein product [Brassica rapa subsp. narinosa]